uniref:Uncharacterized protein n=1 Tax=viral metagenome TaxID=1070528 RepID=A0A6C0LS56_9ZZZZ
MNWPYDDDEYSSSDDYHDCDGDDDCLYMEPRYNSMKSYHDDDDDGERSSEDDTMNGTTKFDKRLSNDTRTLRRTIIERPARINTRSVTRPRRSTRDIKEREFLTVAETPKKPSKPKHKDSSKLSQRTGIMLILKQMAAMLKAGDSIYLIAEYLNSSVDEYREKFTGKTADKECSEASKNSIEKDSPAKNYKDKHKRKELRNNNNIAFDDSELIRESDIKILELKPPVKTFNYAKPEGISGNKKVKIPFNATRKGYCGDCWLCGLKVYFYSNREFITSCGQCEHIGGIVASILTGMLTSSMKDESVYNYGSSHVHCNQKKSDTISMKFDIRTNTWITDDCGINNIVDDILGSDIHATEYDPEFIKSFTTLSESNMKTRIKRYTKIWCQHANNIIIKAGPSKTDFSKKILNIIKYTYDKVQHKFDVIHGGGPDSEDSEVFKLIDLKGFEIDSNINDENVEDILNELRENPLFYELLNNLIKAINETLIEHYDFTPEMIDELSYSNETEYPIAQYPIAQYPTTQYPIAQYPTTQYPIAQYPTNDFYKKYEPINNIFDFPREDFNSNNLISVYGGKQNNKRRTKRRTKKQNNKRRTKRQRKTKV